MEKPKEKRKGNPPKTIEGLNKKIDKLTLELERANDSLQETGDELAKLEEVEMSLRENFTKLKKKQEEIVAQNIDFDLKIAEFEQIVYKRFQLVLFGRRFF